MKRRGHLMPGILARDNLLLAFQRAERGLRRKEEARRYAAELDANLRFLRDGLATGSFPFGHYRRFYVSDPKRRLIHAPAFGERVAQHAIFNRCEPILDRRLLHDVHACRKGKGTSAALRRAQTFSRRHEWWLRLDVRKFFDSVSHDLLLEQLGRVFKDRRLLGLFAAIVDGYHASPGRGLPIGGLASQHFANFHLADLDRLLKERLRIPGYVRYMDDFVLWADQPKDLLRARRAVREWLAPRGLSLKRLAQPVRVSEGMDFLGHKVRPERMELTRRGRTRFVRKARLLRRLWDEGACSDLRLQQGHAALCAYGSLARMKSLQRQIER